MLKVEEVTKSFKEIMVLKKVSLEASRGEMIHISGANGSGKSTLFKLITGLLSPDSGHVQIDDGDVIGALIENPGFLEFETAFTNMRFLANLNRKFDRTYISELMKNFNLDINDHRSVSNYSVGMRQKLGIIQAVMEGQNIILLDEPTRGLDDDSIHQFVLLMTKLVSKNKTIIIASHDKIAALNYDVNYILKDGHLSHE